MSAVKSSERSKSTAYALWCLGFIGLSGFHRVYTGKYLSGTIWLLTWGVFGLGHLVDLLLVPGMVDEYNLKQRLLYGSMTAPRELVLRPGEQATYQLQTDPEAEHNRLVQQLLAVAQQKSGMITVTQGVLATGKSFREVEAALKRLHAEGYAAITNHPVSGAVVYQFDELIE
ncbi:NINE protein [Leptolyngbya sp. FACHB-261]|uniref:NINE protein n=1 Tax=Leptolyngbya sp. FACHB-261 TaxID=2692806 RepID=UPI001689D1F3|nr:NINE protein [Leptolyngbya sp. FACHB-261]MBD2103209.1 NINE protein [Leptolyngbya sp. FACHB-261]